MPQFRFLSPTAVSATFLRQAASVTFYTPKTGTGSTLPPETEPVVSPPETDGNDFLFPTETGVTAFFPAENGNRVFPSVPVPAISFSEVTVKRQGIF